MSEIEVRVPDLGDTKAVTVVEVLVKVGAQMRVDDPLITLESDKASMDVPSTAAGTVTSIAVKKGQEVSTGTVIATLTTAKSETAPEEKAAPAAAGGPRRQHRPQVIRCGGSGSATGSRSTRAAKSPPRHPLRNPRRPRPSAGRSPARSISWSSARDRAATRRPFGPRTWDSR